MKSSHRTRLNFPLIWTVNEQIAFYLRDPVEKRLQSSLASIFTRKTRHDKSKMNKFVAINKSNPPFLWKATTPEQIAKKKREE